MTGLFDTKVRTHKKIYGMEIYVIIKVVILCISDINRGEDAGTNYK